MGEVGTSHDSAATRQASGARASWPHGLNRRAFLKITAGGALALYLPTAIGVRRALASPIEGGSLSPTDIPKYRLPLVVPPRPSVTV